MIILPINTFRNVKIVAIISKINTPVDKLTSRSFSYSKQPSK